MNVMAFVGSPRKGGNTDILLDSFLEEARSKGAETEKVYLYETEINPMSRRKELKDGNSI